MLSVFRARGLDLRDVGVHLVFGHAQCQKRFLHILDLLVIHGQSLLIEMNRLRGLL